MVTIDERTKSSALVQLTNPVNLRRARERLCQSEDREAKSEDHDRPHQHLKTMWCVNKHERRGKIDQQCCQLDEHQSGCIRIKRERVGKTKCGNFRRHFAQWQELD